MRKRTWLEIGIVALGLFLVCASREAAESRAARTGDFAAEAPEGATGLGAPVAPVPSNPVTEPVIPPAQPARPEGQGRR